MFEALYSADSTAFRIINQEMANPLLDAVMPVVTEVKYFYALYAVGALLLLWKGGARGRWCVLLVLLGVLISDPLSSRVIKEWVERVRPCQALDGVRLLIGCGAGKSFPSSHAVNNFMAATIIGYFYRRAIPYALAIAFVIAFSRSYLGVHYPGDLLGGAVIGAGVAAALLLLWGWAMRLWKEDEVDVENASSNDRDSVG